MFNFEKQKVKFQINIVCGIPIINYTNKISFNAKLTDKQSRDKKMDEYYLKPLETTLEIYNSGDTVLIAEMPTEDTRFQFSNITVRVNPHSRSVVTIKYVSKILESTSGTLEIKTNCDQPISKLQYNVNIEKPKLVISPAGSVNFGVVNRSNLPCTLTKNFTVKNYGNAPMSYMVVL